MDLVLRNKLIREVCANGLAEWKTIQDILDTGDTELIALLADENKVKEMGKLLEDEEIKSEFKIKEIAVKIEFEDGDIHEINANVKSIEEYNSYSIITLISYAELSRIDSNIVAIYINRFGYLDNDNKNVDTLKYECVGLDKKTMRKDREDEIMFEYRFESIGKGQIIK